MSADEAMDEDDDAADDQDDNALNDSEGACTCRGVGRPREGTKKKKEKNAALTPPPRPSCNVFQPWTC